MERSAILWGLDKKTILLCALVLLLAFYLSLYILIIIIIVAGYILYRIKKQPDNNDKYKQLLVNLFTIGFSLCVILIVIEVYLHLAQPKIMEISRDIVGDFSDFTSREYLDKRVLSKPAGVFRILGLGDSFARNLTWINKNYHNYLQQRYLENNQKKIDIINAGMEATGPGYYWHILAKYGDSIKPDLVLVGFFAGNDFEEMEFKYVYRGAYQLREFVDPLKRFLSYLRFENSWLYQFCSRKLIMFSEDRARNQELKKIGSNDEATYSEETFYQIEKTRMWIFEKAKRTQFDRLFNQNSQVLLNFKEWCAKRNVALLIVIFPDQFQVDEDLRNKMLEKYAISNAALDINYPDDLLSIFCEQHQINCLDLLKDFQEVNRTTKLYRLRDTHWSETGNRLAADLIYNYFQERQLVSVH